MKQVNGGKATLKPKVGLLIEVVKDRQKLKNMRRESGELDRKVRKEYGEKSNK